MSDKTYSQEEVDALVTARVAEATKAFQEKIDEFEASHKDAEVDAKVAAARAELETKVEELQKSLDEAVIKAEAASKERDELVSFLESEKEKAENAAELAKLAVERAAEVAKVADFPEDYMKANTDRWAAMPEEAFTALLEDYKAVAAKATNGGHEGGGGGLPQHTTLNASRDDKGTPNPIREVFSLRDAGLDPRAL